MKVSIGDVSLWFDVLNAGLVTDGPVMREKPVLLALHGGPGFDHTDFKDILEPFFDLAQVVMYDHRGNGRSDDGDVARWNLEQWGDDVHAFCGALGIEKPFVLGWSFGGMVAQSYASRHPDAIGGLTLLSTAPRISEEQFGPVFERLGGPEARRDRAALPRGSRRERVRRVHARLPPVLHRQARSPAPELRRDSPRHPDRGDPPLLHRGGLADGPASRPYRGHMSDADPQGRARPHHAAGVLRRARGGAAGAPVTRVIGQASSHDVPEDEPELFEGAVRDFLSGCLAAREAQ